MVKLLYHFSVVALFVSAYGEDGPKWCGKNYHKGDPVIPPDLKFPPRNSSPSPLLAFRCFPAIRPYLPGDSASVVLSSQLTHQHIHGSAPIDDVNQNGTLAVTIAIDGRTAASGTISLSTTNAELPVSLVDFAPRADPYSVDCRATYGSQAFESKSSLSYLPLNSNGSVTKLDLRTGAMLAKPADGSEGPYAPVFPIGFYTQFDGYLADNLTLLDEIKMQGFNIVHPIPYFTNMSMLVEVLDHMQELGLYLMYDMRWSYKNLSAVTEQVNAYKTYSNLLLWYTADEPDGWSDDPSLSVAAYETVKAVDPYHPISLVLCCIDYNFAALVPAADVLMQDVYPIGVNSTHSVVWDTECTDDFGDCGCDGCKGNLRDISERMDLFKDRLGALGERKAVWAVPQAFGQASYWSRHPTGMEFLAESLLAISHGAKGIVPWTDPTPPDIKVSASLLALSLPKMTPILFDPASEFTGYTLNTLDVGVWSLSSAHLVIVVNFAPSSATVDLSSIVNGDRTSLLTSGVSENGSMTAFDGFGSAAWLIHATKPSVTSSSSLADFATLLLSVFLALLP